MHTLFRLSPIRFLRRGLAGVAGALPLAAAAGLPPALDRPVDYATEVQPIFADHCQRCHGPEKQKSGLRLDGPEGVARGGDSGEPVLLAGRSAESHLIRLVAASDPDEAMPPEGDRLSAEQIGILRSWIDGGAVLPGGAAPAEKAPASAHWSLQPLAPTEPPVSADTFVRNGIDAFILAGLQDRGLRPSPEAERAALIRRVSGVMHGLSPSPEEVEAFVRDARPGAYERMVERALASPRYGERWARHWMDVVRYAESNGFETNRPRPTAYPYRDYVVRAFNEDKPYDRFILEQLAGDRLGEDAATGFLVAGPYDIVKSPDPSLTLMQRQDELADMVNTTGTAFLGLTLGCARCHNHKFDPIPQKDYYALQAVFAGVQHGERPLTRRETENRREAAAELRLRLTAREKEVAEYRVRAAAATGSGTALRPAVHPRSNAEEFAPVDAVAVRFTVLQTSGSEPCLDELEIFDEAGRNVALATEGGRPSASGTLPGYESHKLEHLNDGRFGNGRSWIADTAGRGWARIDFPEARRIVRAVWGRDREERFTDRVATSYQLEALDPAGQWRTLVSSEDREPFGGAEAPEAFLARLPAEEAALARAALAEVTELRSQLDSLEKGPAVWAGTFQQPGPTRRLYRGDPFQEREEVAPDALSVLGTLGLGPDAPEGERRQRLAEWIADPANPLTARVLVNRLWHYHFGTGLVDTPSDFGANGTEPSHPALLDWLAGELVRSGWSIKHVQRLILMSSTWRQSSRPSEEALGLDAGSRLLWRFPPRRLEAEAIRDSMLQAAGVLDLEMGGPGFYLLEVVPENVVHYFPKEETGPPEWRRMVYMTRIRQEQDSVFGSFDCPDGNQVAPKRSRSTTPLQALNLFNGRFTLQMSGLLAERLRRECGDDPRAQVDRAFRLLYGRGPSQEESADGVAVAGKHGLPAFCRALYNTSEFLFLF